MKNNDIKQTDRVAVEMFDHIVSKQWALSDSQCQKLLGIESVEVQSAINSGMSLTEQQLKRVSLIIGIYRALHILFINEQQANSWITKPNTAFDGQTALEVMLQTGISGLEQVNGYLQAQVH